MKLKALIALLGLVLLLHWAGLSWLSDQLSAGEPLQRMKDPLFTRLIEQTTPAPAAAVAKAPPAAPSRPKKSPSGNPVTQAVLLPKPVDSQPAAPSLPPPNADEGRVAQAEPSSAPMPEAAASASAAVTAVGKGTAATAATGVADLAIAPHLAASDPPTSTAAVAPPALPGFAAAAQTVDGWPPDTRLTYRLTGNYRGELNGSARVQWQRETARAPSRDAGRDTAGETAPGAAPEADAVRPLHAPSAGPLGSIIAAGTGIPPSNPSRPQPRYQVRLDLLLSSFVVLSMTSQGQMTDAGLVPQIYEEKLPGNLRRVSFDGAQVRFQNGGLAAQPSTVQDTASQFVELSRRFSSGRERLQAGASIQLWLARPGGMDAWTYDISGPHALQTPELGTVQAFQLKPRPLANPRGPISAEMWFAPSLQYLPVRVRISLGDGNFVDLLVERIEQGAAPEAVLPPKTGQN